MVKLRIWLRGVHALWVLNCEVIALIIEAVEVGIGAIVLLLEAEMSVLSILVSTLVQVAQAGAVGIEAVGTVIPNLLSKVSGGHQQKGKR